MTGLRQSLLLLTAWLAVFSVSAQPSPIPARVPASLENSNSLMLLTPSLPPSPVTLFRNLLAMSVPERASFLTNRPPQIRASILAKVREYQAMPPDERELRLQATELRWYLMPLLHDSSTNLNMLLARVPASLQELVKSRLAQWEILPPPLKQEFLENDRAVHYFSRIEPPGAAGPNLSDEQRQAIADQFNQFFELTPVEKQKALRTLSGTERAQMEKTLQAFGQLPLRQRLLCLHNYAKFAGMNAGERTDFLKNAERWSQMTPAERQTWRDLVANVPLWPPVPPAAIPAGLIPHAPPRPAHTSVATN